MFRVPGRIPEDRLRTPPLGTPEKIIIARFLGVPNRIRTCDLLIKSQLLYRLSYGHDRTVGINRSGHLGCAKGAVNRYLHGMA